MFGSICYPYAWDTKKNKFDPKTIPSVFVGYSDKHKGYKCFDSKTHRMFVSRHVVSDENLFPYKTSKSLSSFIDSITTFLDSPSPISTNLTSLAMDLMHIPIPTPISSSSSSISDPTSSDVPSELSTNQSYDHTSINTDLKFSPQAHDMPSSTPLLIEDNHSVSIHPASSS